LALSWCDGAGFDVVIVLGADDLSDVRGGRMLGGFGLSLGAMVGCVLCGALLAPVITLSQAATSFSGRCFDYDAAGRLSGVRDEGGQLRSYGLDPASNRKGVVGTSGAVVCSGTGAGAGVPTPAMFSPLALAGSAASAPSASNNTSPVANPDQLSVAQWGTQSVLVLNNDTDGDSDPLEVIAAAYDSAKVQVTRVKSLTSGDRYVYLDVVGVAPGSTQISYTISDGRGGQSVSTVTVMVTAPNYQ
jgi:YD repeat-containing protein